MVASATKVELQLDPLEADVGKEDTSVGKLVGVEIPLFVGVRIEAVSVGIGVAVCPTADCALNAS